MDLIINRPINILSNIQESFREFDIEKAFAPEGSRKQTKRGEWYIKQGGKWIYEKKGGGASEKSEASSSGEASTIKQLKLGKYNIETLRGLDDKDFNNYGMIGFDKLSRYKYSAQTAAHAIMAEGIKLGYVVKLDMGRGKGKYYTTELAEKMDLDSIIQNIKDNKPLDNAI